MWKPQVESLFVAADKNKSDEIGGHLTRRMAEPREGDSGQGEDMIEHNRALAPMSVDECEKTRAERPDHIFPFWYHLREKPVDTQGGGIGLKPKCRWTMVGSTTPKF